jgi:hypothetical protein
VGPQVSDHDITAENFERAEQLISVLFETGAWPDAALNHFKIDSTGFANFNKFAVERIRKLYPDIDPRHEAAIATMMVHQTLVGIAVGRGTGYSTDSGLNT